MEMLQWVERWANINSGSDNLPGLEMLLSVLKEAFCSLNAEIQDVALPPRKEIDSLGHLKEIPSAPLLFLKKHPQALIQLILVGHYDTVYGTSSSFQTVERASDTVLKGPGVADMKGGLAVMLQVLTDLESSELAGKIGWEVIINPDEEIGSPGSEKFIEEKAKGKLLGLIFEPAFSDGRLVSSRKGSVNYTVVARGRAAHAGRDFHKGKNAISALAQFIVKADPLTQVDQGTTLNFGRIEGGIASNIVPDLAICKLNVRISHHDDMLLIKKELEKIAKEINTIEGLSIELHETSARGPKPFDKKSEILFDAFRECGSELGLKIDWLPSGGVSDGNSVAAAGTPCIDTLGAVGGNIHTHEEYIEITSLAERAALTSLFLKKLATGALKFDGKAER